MADSITPLFRVCTKCGAERPFTEFTRHKRAKFGRRSTCRSCATARQRELRSTPEWIARMRERDRKRWRDGTKGRVLGPEVNARRYAAWKVRMENEENRKRQNARNQFASAIRSGKIARPTRCESCGRECKPQAHHEDYAKPLEVVWLCTECHGRTWRKPEPVGESPYRLHHKDGPPTPIADAIRAVLSQANAPMTAAQITRRINSNPGTVWQSLSYTLAGEVEQVAPRGPWRLKR